MKNIFKKNQIIITALAIMIAIAGYLSFTNRDAAEDTNTVEATNPDFEDYGEFTDENGLEMVTNTDTTDTTGTTDANDETTDTIDTTDTTDTQADDTGIADTTDGEDAEAAAEEEDDVETLEEQDELGDISDEDLLETAQNVADNGELDLEDGVPGEAVLASAALDSGYYISTKLDREQLRSKSKATLMEIIQSSNVSDGTKKDATNKLIEIIEIAEKENAVEKLLEAKGFDGAVVFINDGAADVVVNASALTDQQLAIIENVVKNKTDIAAEKITINPGVVSE